jgi:hypothetical protein
MLYPFLLVEEWSGPGLLEHGEHSISRAYAILWKKQTVDFTELAKKRWIDRWSMECLASHFGLGRTATIRYLGLCRLNPELVKDGKARRFMLLKRRRFLGK